MVTTSEAWQTATRAEPNKEFLDRSLVDVFLSLSPSERETWFATTDRAAELAGVSRRTIQFWIEVGLVRAVRAGKRYQVSLSSLRDYLDSVSPT